MLFLLRAGSQAAPGDLAWLPPAFAGAIGLVFLPLALVLAQRTRSAVRVDRGAGVVLVRTGAGLRLHETVLPLQDVAACAIFGSQERTMPSGGGALGLASIGIALAAPSYREEYKVVLRLHGRGWPIPVTPHRVLQPYALLPLARALAEALGCPLDTPFDTGMARPAPGA